MIGANEFASGVGYKDAPTVLTFPTVEAATVAVRSGWAVVDGVLSCVMCQRRLWRKTDIDAAEDDRSRITCDGNRLHVTRFGPPPEWVRAAEPCERCEGDGLEGVYGMNRPPCFACHGVGKPRVEVTAPCDHRTCGEPRRSEGMEWTCDHWQTDGSIHVAWVTVTEVLVDDDAIRNDPCPEVPHAYILGNEVRRCDGDIGDSDITADVAHLGASETLIGKYLLRLDERARPS